MQNWILILTGGESSHLLGAYKMTEQDRLNGEYLTFREVILGFLTLALAIAPLIVILILIEVN